MKKYILYLPVFLLFGCSTITRVNKGVDFQSAKLSQFKIHETQRVEFLKAFPSPLEVNESEKDGVHIKIYTYAYGNADIAKMRLRLLISEFRDEVWNGFLFKSNFEEDGTNFDERKRFSFKMNTTTKNEVRKAIGIPSGIMFVPTSLRDTLLDDSDLDKILRGAWEVWQYWYTDYPNLSESSWLDKRLWLLFDNKGKLVGQEYRSNFPQQKQLNQTDPEGQ